MTWGRFASGGRRKGTGGVRALGRLPDGEMNRTEATFAGWLEAQPDVAWWRFEPFALKLAPACSYTPDFLVLKEDGSLLVIEVKGRWMDDARAKVKLAAAAFPVLQVWAVLARGKDPSAWEWERFPSGWAGEALSEASPPPSPRGARPV